MNSREYQKAMACFEPDPYLRARVAAAVKEGRRPRTRPLWRTLTAVCAAALVCTAAAGIPFVREIIKSPDSTQPTDPIQLVEYENACYEVIEDHPQWLERAGIAAEITEDVIGEHITYLQKEHPENTYSNYIAAQGETDIELLEYAPAPYQAVRVLRDGGQYFAVLFCNYLIPDEDSLPFREVFAVNGIGGAEDIVSITPTKAGDAWKAAGETVTDRARVSSFFHEILFLEAYSEDAYHRIEFSHIDEAGAGKYYAEYGKESRNIMIENADGLRFTVRYDPAHGWIYGGETQTYYKMTPAMMEWFHENITN